MDEGNGNTVATATLDALGLRRPTPLKPYDFDKGIEGDTITSNIEYVRLEVREGRLAPHLAFDTLDQLWANEVAALKAEIQRLIHAH